MASLVYRLSAEIKGKKYPRKFNMVLKCFDIYIDQKPGSLAILSDNMLIHEIHVFEEWTEFLVYDSRSY